MITIPRVIETSPGTSYALRVTDLTKRYGRNEGVDSINLQVPEGAIYLLAGPNGAGKSTTLKSVMGLIGIDRGTIEIFGDQAGGDSPLSRVNIGYMPEGVEWGLDWMRVKDLLKFHSSFFPDWDSLYFEELQDRFKLKLKSRFGSLSKGERRRVQLVMSLAHKPRLLLLDEPTDGLDPLIREETYSTLIEHSERFSTTMVISTHHIEEIDRLADHIGILVGGHIVAQTSVSNLRAGLLSYVVASDNHANIRKSMSGRIVRTKEMTGNERTYYVWGEPAEATLHFTDSGGEVLNVSSLSLFDSTVALLKLGESE